MPTLRALEGVACTILRLAFPDTALADWFASAETKALIAKADAGDIDAQFRAGAAYDYGRGAPRSAENAMKYYLLAAERRHVEAQNGAGSILQPEKRYAEAIPWYQRTAAQGHPMATNSLAYLYDMGWGSNRTAKKDSNSTPARPSLGGLRRCGISPTCTAPANWEKSISSWRVCGHSERKNSRGQRTAN